MMMKEKNKSSGCSKRKNLKLKRNNKDNLGNNNISKNDKSIRIKKHANNKVNKTKKTRKSKNNK